MTNQTKITIIGWAGFIIMLVLFLQRCGSSQPQSAKSTTNTIVKQRWDSVLKKVPVYLKGPSGVIYDTVPSIIDTAKILQKYFNRYFYSQPVDDTAISAVITDTVSQNKIIGKGFQYHFKKAFSTTTINTTKIDTVINYTSRILYVGGFIASNTTGTSFGFGPQLSFTTKKNTLYHVNYDLLHKRIEAGAHIKIKFGK